MSTKVTILHSNPPDADFHLFSDIFDEGAVWLELAGAPTFVAEPDRIRLRIPLDVWNVIRTGSPANFDAPLEPLEAVLVDSEPVVKNDESADGGASVPLLTQKFHDRLTDATIEVTKKESGSSSIKITNVIMPAVGYGSTEIEFDAHGLIQSIVAHFGPA